MKDCDQKTSSVVSDLLDVSEKERRLELNRAAAMRSRLKKKQELEQLQGQAEALTAAKATSEKRVQQYEVLLQESYKEAAATQSRLLQCINERAVLQLRLKDLLSSSQ